MRVTKNDKEKATPRKDSLSDVRALALFLNCDFKARHTNQIEQVKKQLDRWARIEFERALRNNDEVLKVQAELREDVIPILAPDSHIAPVEAEKRLRSLLNKINAIKHEERASTSWDLEMADYEWVDLGEPPDGGGFALLPKDPEDRGSARNWWLDKKLTLMGYDWFLGATRGIEATSLRNQMYLTISRTLENASFDRLRACLLQSCKKCFVAEDARQRFCRPKHRNEFNNKERLASTYYQQRRQKKRRQLLAKARKLSREGKSPGEIIRLSKLSSRVLRKERVIR